MKFFNQLAAAFAACVIVAIVAVSIPIVGARNIPPGALKSDPNNHVDAPAPTTKKVCAWHNNTSSTGAIGGALAPDGQCSVDQSAELRSPCTCTQRGHPDPIVHNGTVIDVPVDNRRSE